MNATLEKELSALSVAEKAEVIDYLIPKVMGAEGEIPPALLAELERRDEEYERNPSGGMTLEDFDRKWAGRK
jgi:putative addiction module component (TIGR02574 family)